MKNNLLRSPLAFLHNLLLAYIVYMLCRVAYVCENWALYAEGWHSLNLWNALVGSLRFDTAALGYTMVLYAVMMLLPLPCRDHHLYQRTAKWVYIVINSLAIAVNLADSVYSQFTGRRTTASFFREFQNDGNLGSIIGIELLNHWYLVLTGIAIIAMMWFLYWQPFKTKTARQRRSWHFYAVNIPIFLIYFPLCICGIRGGATKATRPIAISNANQYVNTPSQTAIVLNTTFSFLRTIGVTTFSDPHYYTPEELDNIYTPVHIPTDSAAYNLGNKNVVVLIVESFGSEYIGALNDYEGYTPFADSLISQSLTFTTSLANGRKSIDGMPSVLSSIPMFVEPFFITAYSVNKVNGIAGELAKVGYTTAFFHGAENGSMGFQAFARASGFQQYYGRTEYNNDSRFGGDKDFDGTWAIWDEPFLQFFALKMSELPQPFVTTVFTATSHHPFVVPQQYAKTLHADGHPMHTCIRYTDMALQRFFETARRQPWFNNTIFVITADHTNVSSHAAYSTSMGSYRVPIIFYDPSGTLPHGRDTRIAQQIDIMPTLLNLLGYPNPYIAFGTDLLNTPKETSWAINYQGGVYQYIRGDLLLQHDGTRPTALYNYATDTLLQTNLLGTPQHSAQQQQMEQQLKAVVQSYMQRMIGDQLTYQQ